MRPAHVALVLGLALLTPLPALAERPAERDLVAVVDFTVTSNLLAREPELGRSLAALARASLDDFFRVVDREKVATALAERKLEGAALFDSSPKAAALGEALGAKRVFVGLATTFGRKIVVHLKHLDMANRHFDRSETATVTDLEELPELFPAMVERLLAPAAPEEPETVTEKGAKPAGVEEHLKNLESEEAGVRFGAAVELGRSGDPSAARALLSVLETDTDIFVRRAAARSLGELDSWEAVPTLIATIGDKEFFVAITANKALQRITGQDFGFREGLAVSGIEAVIAKANEWWTEHADDR